MKAKSLIGETFGRLTVVEQLPTKDGRAMWHCVCECGGTNDVASCTLKAGLTRSCGCLRREMTGDAHRTHGLSKSPEHDTWCHIKGRCYNPKTKQFKDYGGRGIVVCERWRNSFEAFLEDMGPKLSPELEIDRKENSGNYSCGRCEECVRNGWDANCRWTTKEVNNNNKRSNVRITAFGETRTAAEWSRDPRCRVTHMALWFRIVESGWEPEKAITEPSKEIATPRGLVEAFGESKTLAEWSRDPRCAVNYDALKRRFLLGNLGPEEAITKPAQDRGVSPTTTAFGETKLLSEWAKDHRCVVNYYTLNNRVVRSNWPPELAITTPTLPVGLSRQEVGILSVPDGEASAT